MQRVSSRYKNVGGILYYGRSFENKLLVSISAIGYQKEAATVDTDAPVNQLLEYITTYPHNSIAYRESDMILDAHSDASYLNKSLSCSSAGSHIFSQKMTPRLHLMDQFPPLPRSSNSSFPQQLNLNLARFLLRLKKWFICAKHASKWDGLNLPIPSKLITPHPLALSTKPFSLDA